MTLPAFFADQTAGHDPQSFLVLGSIRPAEEQPERAVRLKAGGEAAGLSFAAPADRGLDPLAAIHTPEYLGFLQTIHARWRELPGAAPDLAVLMAVGEKVC